MSGCLRPLLVVLRRQVDGGYVVDTRQWTGRSLRRLRVIRAGALERPEARARLRRIRKMAEALRGGA
jgi:hypothetical protein